MTIVDKYASSWRQEIKSKKGSGLKRFRQSSDWQIEEFKGMESFCQLVFPKNFVINIGVTYNYQKTTAGKKATTQIHLDLKGEICGYLRAKSGSSGRSLSWFL